MQFTRWLERRTAPEIPESDRLMRIIMKAGPGGVAEGDLKQRIDLPRETVDQLLMGLVQLGLIFVSGQYGVRVIRPANSRAAQFLWK